MSLSACSRSVTFNATILEVREKTILIRPDDESKELQSSDLITVSLSEAILIDSNGNEIEIEHIQVGNKVEITYSGEIAESYPAQIFNCYKVKILD